MAAPHARSSSKTAKSKEKSVLPIHFADDALTRVSRDTLKALAKRLGFNETQTVHYALAFLKKEMDERAKAPRQEEGDYPPLSGKHLEAVREHQPRRKKTGIVESLIR
jgi:hypothetical protein